MDRLRKFGKKALLAFLRWRRQAGMLWLSLGPWQWAAAIFFGAAFGLGTAFLSVTGGRGELHAGVWATSLVYGSTEADIYTRARVALFGLLALSREQTVYYTAARDGAGAALSGDCTYVVTGRDFDARWWSITAYGPDSYLIANGEGVYSYSKTTVAREPNGRFVIRVSADEQPGNWLPVRRGARFDMTARLYNPDAAVIEDPEGVLLPTVVKEGCR